MKVVAKVRGEEVGVDMNEDKAGDRVGVVGVVNCPRAVSRLFRVVFSFIFTLRLTDEM